MFSNCLTITDSELPDEMTALISATKFVTKTSASFASAAHPKVAVPTAANIVVENKKRRLPIIFLIIHLIVGIRVHFRNFWVKPKTAPLKIG